MGEKHLRSQEEDSITVTETLLQVNFCGPPIRPGETDQTFNKWTDRGITAIHTLTDEKTFMLFNKVKKQNKKNIYIFWYLQLRYFYNPQVYAGK